MHDIKIAILTPNNNSYTETFIQKHIDFLPFKKIVIYGDLIPYIVQGEEYESFQIGFFEKIKRKFTSVKPSYGDDYKKQKLKHHLEKHKIQVVLAEYVLVGSLVFEICKKLNIPIIATGLGYELAIHKILNEHKETYSNFFKYCSAIIIVAKSMEKVLIKLGCSSEKIIHSPAGASEDFYEIEPNYNSFQLFAIGRFIEKKSPHLTILSFYHVLKKYPQSKLIFAGDGPLLNFCKDIVSTLKMENNVDFVGKISQDQQRKFLKESRIFVQHSRVASDGDSEGTPVAIVEASSAGLPVVSTLHAGIIDVIINNETGYLVNEGDVDSMTSKIIELLDSSELSKKMGIAGKLNIKNNFTLKKHINLIEEVILKAVKSTI